MRTNLWVFKIFRMQSISCSTFIRSILMAATSKGRREMKSWVTFWHRRLTVTKKPETFGMGVRIIPFLKKSFTQIHRATSQQRWCCFLIVFRSLGYNWFIVGPSRATTTTLFTSMFEEQGSIGIPTKIPQWFSPCYNFYLKRANLVNQSEWNKRINVCSTKESRGWRSYNCNTLEWMYYKMSLTKSFIEHVRTNHLTKSLWNLMLHEESVKDLTVINDVQFLGVYPDGHLSWNKYELALQLKKTGAFSSPYTCSSALFTYWVIINATHRRLS